MNALTDIPAVSGLEQLRAAFDGSREHTFGIGKSDNWEHKICCALETDDFDAAIAAAKTAGTSFVMEPFDTPVCRMAMVLDPAGNKVMIHQRKPGHD